MINVLSQISLPEQEIEMLQSKYNLKIHKIHGDDLPKKEVLDQIEIYIGWRLKVPIKAMPNLKWIHFFMAGMDRYTEMFRKLNNPPIVTNGSGTFDVPIGEHSIAVLLGVIRNINKYVINQSQRLWKNEGEVQDIKGSTAGIVGFGNIGSYTAKLLKAFGAKILVQKVSKINKPDYVDEVFYGNDGLDEMIPKCDFVLIFLPGTEQTRNLFDKQRLLKMKKGAVITNIGRGHVINSDALAELIEQGHIGGAGLDVTDPEPLNKDHKLWGLSNVIITPHVSYWSPNDKHRMVGVFEDNLKKYLENEKMPNEIDFNKGY